MSGDCGPDQLASAEHPPGPELDPRRPHLGPPSVEHGAALWRIARDSGSLDLNSAYSYLLWCRDFAATSVVAQVGGEVAGFVTGYLRPSAADTLVVWQVAVDSAHRGRGLARTMLDHLADRVHLTGARYVEASVTPDNVASTRLFTAFAEGRGADLHRSELFGATLFPERHETEVLFRIGSLTATAGAT